jgi:hypothetical protein
LFWGAKFVLVVTVASALLLAARWVRPDRLISRVTFRVALVSVQGMTIGLAGVSLSNAMLLSSMQG